LDEHRQLVPPLFSAGARRPAAVIIAVCALVTLVIGIIYWHSSQPGSLNRSVDSWVRAGIGMHMRALILVHDLGQPVQVTIIAIVIAIACLTARRINGALLTIISLPLAEVLTEKLLKPLFDRTLGGAPDYPSGHTCATFALATVLAVLLLNQASKRPGRFWRIAIVVVGFLAGCAVGVAMIGLGFHYFTDTIGGAAVGVGVVLAIAFLLDLPGTRRLLPVSFTRSRSARDTDSLDQPSAAGHRAGR
jgi:membrane-associated phospholipid phosphatase